MLTCFTLTNALKGVLLLAAEAFGEEVSLKTIIYNPLKDEKEEYNGYQLNYKLKDLKQNQIPLLEVELKGKGKIIMDLFQHPYKNHKH